ncbi:MAG: TlpA family protein disulfide reductase [Gemmatimonadetes bacterium]|nr:TlpA family protein disulfide reductase [Gemmatimonadota bacterium]
MVATFERTSVRIAVALLLALPFGVSAQAAGEGSVSLPIGTVGPSAALEDLQGNPIDLLNYTRGKPTIIEFWATWCGLCERLQPQIDRIHAQYGTRLNVVAVAVGVAQTVRRVQRHIDEHKTPYPVLWDARGGAVRAYNATTTSIVVMLDAQGRVAYTGVGGDQDLVGAAARLLGS